MTVKAPPVWHCARCGRQLRDQQWIYSKHTHRRYCPPGRGCDKQQRRVTQTRVATNLPA